MQHRTRIVGLSDSEKRQPKFRIVASRRPHGPAISLFVGQAIPTVAGLALLRDGVKPPRFFPGLHI